MGLGAVRKLAPLMLMAVMLSGCGTLLGISKSVDTFDLASATVKPREHPRRHVQLLIPTPTALKMFDGQNIVIRSGPSSIAYLSGAQWADRLSKIVQDKLLQAFEDTGRVGGVGTPGQGLAIDDQVVTEIRDFSIDTSSGNNAVVEIAAKVLDDRNGTVRAARVFQASVPVEGKANADYVRALQSAFDKVTTEIVTWTLATL
jgi:cholesterol transport system auxiliary component